MARARVGLWLVVVVVCLAAGAGVFAWVASTPSMTRACTLAGVISEARTATPEEAAKVLTEGQLAGFDRHSKTEWRRDLGDGSFQRLVVDQDDDGWYVVDFNTCSEL